MMKTYLDFAASAYQYWNIALSTAQSSTWSWKQNSLVTVDKEKRSFRFNPDYYVMRHLTQFVRPGARYVKGFGFGGNDSQMVFRDDDGFYVILVANAVPDRQVMSILLGSFIVKVVMPGNSFNTIVVPASRTKGT